MKGLTKSEVKKIIFLKVIRVIILGFDALKNVQLRNGKVFPAVTHEKIPFGSIKNTETPPTV